MSEIKFVYFDIGGVLFNWHVALKSLARYLQRPYNKVEAVLKKYDDDVCRDKITTNQFWQYYKSELNSDAKINDFADWWTDNFVPIKQMHDLAREISKKYRIGVVTNIYKGVYEKIIKKGHIPDLNYETVIKSCDINLIKPEDEFFLYAQRKANVLPSEILFIDDDNKNIEKAKNLGWNGVWYDEKNPDDAIKRIKETLNLA